MSKEQDFTPTGIKLEGQYETDRNTDNTELFTAILHEAYGEPDKAFQAIVGHHIIFVRMDKREDGFTYTIVEEFPSADCLIFDHEVAKKIWGEANWKLALEKLALEPVESRDKLLKYLYENRPEVKA